MTTPEHRASGSTAPSGPQAAEQPSVDEQRVELEELREELGETVEELARRVDVPARVKARREELVGQAKDLGEQAKVTVVEKAPVVREQVRNNPGAVAAAAAVLVLVLLLRRRAKRRAASSL